MKISKITYCIGIIFLAPVWGALVLTNITPKAGSGDVTAGVVFGASVINNTYPSKVLELRLDTAYKLFREGKISKIIVSGDTRSSNYNEPKVMRNYLIDKGVDPYFVLEDVAGTRTLDTCYRLKHTFNLDSVVLITQDFHMPRANLLCRGVGLKTSIAAAPSSSQSVTLTGTLREYPALLYNAGLLLTKYKPSN